MDGNIMEYNCLRKTNRWPMVINYNLINVATNNAFILMKKNGYTKSKSEFLQRLAIQLCQANVNSPHRRINYSLKIVGTKLGLVQETAIQPNANSNNKIVKFTRCFVCKTNTRSKCCECGKGVCAKHKITKKTDYCQEHSN